MGVPPNPFLSMEDSLLTSLGPNHSYTAYTAVLPFEAEFDPWAAQGWVHKHWIPLCAWAGSLTSSLCSQARHGWPPGLHSTSEYGVGPWQCSVYLASAGRYLSYCIVSLQVEYTGQCATLVSWNLIRSLLLDLGVHCVQVGRAGGHCIHSAQEAAADIPPLVSPPHSAHLRVLLL